MGRLDEHRRWLRMCQMARLKKLLSHLKEWEKAVQQMVGGGLQQMGTLCVDPDPNTVEQWVSAFPMRQPFNTVPQAELTPTIKLFSLLLYNCGFATIVAKYLC